MGAGVADMLHGVSVDGIDMGTGAGGAGGADGAGGTGTGGSASLVCMDSSAWLSSAWRDFRYSEYDIGCSQHFRDGVRREDETGRMLLLIESLSAGRRWAREDNGEACPV